MFFVVSVLIGYCLQGRDGLIVVATQMMNIIILNRGILYKMYIVYKRRTDSMLCEVIEKINKTDLKI